MTAGLEHGAAMIERGVGDLLRAEVDALVNAVNCRGVMGKGLALQFKKAFPEVFVAYSAACDGGTVRIGRVHVVERQGSPRFVINFPTKDDWRKPSKLEFIEAGLLDLVEQVRSRRIKSLAIPALGCGLGGLDWSQVRLMIVEAFATENVRVVLFEPERG